MPAGRVVRLTVSRKTRMPSLKDRYSYKMGTAVPNPDLKAEHNLTFEGGYQGALGAEDVVPGERLLQPHRRPDPALLPAAEPLAAAQHRPRRRARGFELDARTRLVPRLDLGANYTFLNRENLSDPATPLVDAPRHKGRVSATVTVLPSVRVMAGVDFEAGRRTQNEAGNYFDVAVVRVGNLKVSWTVRRDLDAEVSVLNAFDKYYWVTEGYPEAGRTVVGGLKYRL